MVSPDAGFSLQKLIQKNYPKHGKCFYIQKCFLLPYYAGKIRNHLMTNNRRMSQVNKKDGGKSHEIPFREAAGSIVDTHMCTEKGMEGNTHPKK